MNTQFIKNDINQAIDHLRRAHDFVDAYPDRCLLNILIVREIVNALKHELLPIPKQLDPAQALIPMTP